jgi:hypothetical protein
MIWRNGLKIIARLQSLLICISRTPRLFVGVVVGFGLSAAALAWSGVQFKAVTGHEPFDVQNGLTRTDIAAQLADYTPASRSAYILFAAVDFAFPLLGSLFLGALIAFLLRNALPSVYAWVSARRLLVLALVPALFDWAENVAALLLINLAQGSDVLATALLIFKQLKLISLAATQVVVGLLLVTWLVRLVQRGLHRLHSS